MYVRCFVLIYEWVGLEVMYDVNYFCVNRLMLRLLVVDRVEGDNFVIASVFN